MSNDTSILAGGNLRTQAQAVSNTIAMRGHDGPLNVDSCIVARRGNFFIAEVTAHRSPMLHQRRYIGVCKYNPTDAFSLDAGVKLAIYRAIHPDTRALMEVM